MQRVWDGVGRKEQTSSSKWSDFAGAGHDLEVLDALLDFVDDDPEAEARFIEWLTRDVDVRAGELADAMSSQGRDGGIGR